VTRSRWTRGTALSAALGLSLALGVLPAAAGPSANVDGALVLGHLGPETGELAPVLDSLRTPVRLAVDEINAAGGIDGTPVTLLTGDEGVDAVAAGQALDTMLEGGADAIIGPASSSTALEILRATEDRALVCSGSNSAAALTREGPRRSGNLYFRTAPPDRFQGPALAEQILAAGHRRVAVIAGDDESGDLFARTLEAALRDGGAKVPVVVRYDPESDDLSAPVQKALDTTPQAVAVIGELEDGAAVVRALVAAGAGPQQLPIYGTDALYSSAFAELVDPVNPGVVAGLAGTAPASAPSGVTSPFYDAFAVTGIDPVFSAHSYDCTILTALAAVKAKSDDPRKMAKVFASNVKGANDCNTFVACRDLLVAGKTIHWRGASSAFERFGKFEPTEGVYQPWAYDTDGTPRDGDPSTQITIP
jgi:branched-chain amino acid transport system substrate-binding protein